MTQLQGLSEYQSIDAVGGIDSASPEQLVQMLLDGALQRVATAKGHMMRGETAQKGEMIGKSISIIEGLRTSLDTSAGEIASNLHDLYEYLGSRLLVANLENDVAALDEVSSLLGDIKSAWDVIADDPSDAGAAPANGGV